MIKNEDNLSINKLPPNFDTRSKLEFLNELKKKYSDANFSVPPYLFLKEKNINPLPLAGISSITTLVNNENGYYFFYKSDRYGFNNPDILHDEKEFEYLLLGDSFVHAENVNYPEEIAPVMCVADQY